MAKKAKIGKGILFGIGILITAAAQSWMEEKKQEDYIDNRLDEKLSEWDWTPTPANNNNKKKGR